MYKKAFIVDDDEISIFLAEATLEVESLATDIQGFPDAKQALDTLITLLQNQPDNVPELILLDLNMPLLSGWDFLNALAPYEEQLANRCRIYILTSSVDKQEIQKAQDYNLVTGFLQKPLEDEALEKLKKGM
ncbi:MAG: response regulator [Hymenobacteraceae bacterium]|nr:response regulator [Hymenobacteraceae bacterium]MDX5482181.1 response regulator [Hymenobacteraceae bacterium]